MPGHRDVFGTGFGERGDLEKLKGQLGAYENESFSTYGFGGDGKKEHRFFGVAVMPELKGRPMKRRRSGSAIG